MTALSIGTPIGRWAGFGPYYAMFPVDFAFEVVREYCPEAGCVFDPFAGRGTSIFAAAAQGRYGLGVELHPVAWIYGNVKLHPASERAVLRRLKELGALTNDPEHRCRTLGYVRGLPEFFHMCYAERVLNFLAVARQVLRWRQSRTDATLMAFILVYLHAKEGGGLSNQMRQSKAMSPAYSVRWWTQQGSQPPDVDPILWLTSRVKWRYATGLPQLHRARVWRGDSTVQLRHAMGCISRGYMRRFDLLFTSPPYQGITNYHYDQWLRLWMLGGTPRPIAAEERNCGRFDCRISYRELLQRVFSQTALLLRENAIVYVRTDAREFTRTTTESVLREIFPRKQLEIMERPLKATTQTSLFGDTSNKPGEVDIILAP